MRASPFLLGLACMLGAVVRMSAAVAADYAVQLSASTQTNPAAITLSWPPEAGATNYLLYRKFGNVSAWGSPTSLGPNATNYVDSNVTIGVAYEYRIIKTTAEHAGVGYLYGGIALPLVENRGKMVLLVDDTVSSSLAMELSRLQQDLVGEGWIVLRHDVSRTDSVTNIKAIIKAEYQSDPSNVKAVFLFGHVPVPYSGNFAPDAHGNHQGAWPADVYYGELDGIWTDSAVTSTFASDSRNWNLPGDGKFDSTSLPSDVELQVGRVDLANMPAFSRDEVELLRQYLNKNHNFRSKLITAEQRGLVDDNFGENGGEAFAANGWRNFAPFFGATNSSPGDWFGTLAAQTHLWAYGCGPGTFTSAGGIGSTADFAANDPKVIFTMMIGSYFGDWDSVNNFLRAPLATPTYTLSCAWAGRPNWQFHHMAMGETIGFSTRLTQNNSTLYAGGASYRYVHIALMGDPTLRMHVVAPPTNLIVVPAGSSVNLSWNASPDPVLGYHVYRAASLAGPFTRLNGGLIADTNYTDSTPTVTNYMVRAVKLEVSGSGSYYNASRGIFATIALSPAPVLTISDWGAGVYAIRGVGLSNRTYRIEHAADPGEAVWPTLLEVTTDALGHFFFIDESNSPRRFYRAIHP